MAEPNPKSPEARNLIEYTLMAWDIKNQLWLPEEVESARNWLKKNYQQVLSLETLFKIFGKAAVEEECRLIIAERCEYLEIMGQLLALGSPNESCHRCGGGGSLTSFTFGLKKIISTKRDWGSTIASLAISAVTLPIIGYGRLSGPMKEETVHVLRLQLMLCQYCENIKKENLGFTKRIRLGKEDYALHPWWEKAHELGYTHFLTEAELKEYR